MPGRFALGVVAASLSAMLALSALFVLNARAASAASGGSGAAGDPVWFVFVQMLIVAGWLVLAIVTAFGGLAIKWRSVGRGFTWLRVILVGAFAGGGIVAGLWRVITAGQAWRINDFLMFGVGAVAGAVAAAVFSLVLRGHPHNGNSRVTVGH